MTKFINDLILYFRSKTNKTLLDKNNSNWNNAYFSWKLKGEYKQVLNHIYEAYQFHLKKTPYPEIIFLDIPQSTGFRIVFEKKIPHHSANFLFEYFKDICLQNGRYYLAHHSSDKQADGSVLQQYYLKPQYAINEQNQQIQQFGNIMLELSIRNNRAKFIKLVRNLYAGRNYEQAYDFNSLLNIITKK